MLIVGKFIELGSDIIFEEWRMDIGESVSSGRFGLQAL